MFEKRCRILSQFSSHPTNPHVLFCSFSLFIIRQRKKKHLYEHHWVRKTTGSKNGIGSELDFPNIKQNHLSLSLFILFIHYMTRKDKTKHLYGRQWVSKTTGSRKWCRIWTQFSSHHKKSRLRFYLFFLFVTGREKANQNIFMNVNDRQNNRLEKWCRIWSQSSLYHTNPRVSYLIYYKAREDRANHPNGHQQTNKTTSSTNVGPALAIPRIRRRRVHMWVHLLLLFNSAVVCLQKRGDRPHAKSRNMKRERCHHLHELRVHIP